MKHFFGKDEVHYFFGIVESINDPDRLGRIQVRMFGRNHPDKQILPTEDLIWALVLNPVTSASISGIGVSPTGIKQGSTVMGILLDGDKSQQPIILGTIAGWPEKQDE